MQLTIRALILPSCAINHIRSLTIHILTRESTGKGAKKLEL